MIVSIVLDTEYMGVAERNKWFLKVVSNAMKEDTLIVTHSYFKEHLTEVVEGCADRFFKEFEMNRVQVQEIEKLDICYIPDVIFDLIYRKCGSRTKQIVYLFNNNVKEIEEYIINSIDTALKKRGESRPKFIFNSLHVFEFVKVIAKHYGCPIVPWVFSAIRKAHGYQETLYTAHIDDNLFNNDAFNRLYEKKGEYDLGYSLFSKQEILALLGKRHNLVLVPLINKKPKYEVGIAGEGYKIIPEVYEKDRLTDDDLYYECKLHYDESQLITRQHPMQLDQVGVGRGHMKNDPAAFLLSCNRIITVQSQMILKAAMWGRTPVLMCNALPYSNLMRNSVCESKNLSDYDLNFILFVYFVPDRCMFDSSYWSWRVDNPSIKELAIKHLSVILDDLHVSDDVLHRTDNRLEYLLSLRGITDATINSIIHPADSYENVPYDYPSSCAIFFLEDGSVYKDYSLNYYSDGVMTTLFEVPRDAIKCDLILQNDLDGYISFDSIRLDDSIVTVSSDEVYYPKNEVNKTLQLSPGEIKTISIKWHIRKYGE